MNKEEFIQEVKKLGIDISETKLEQLDSYYHLLVSENEKYNLTSITAEEDVYLKHFYDSLTIIKGIKLNDQYLCDLGTGAGFPGMVLKIMFPNIKIDLIDATAKKCHFLELVIKQLDLKNITVINTRAEEYSQVVREKYDFVISRAVAPLKHLLEYGIPLLKIDGTFIAMKSHLEMELNNINNYYQKLNLINEKIIKFKLPYEESDRLIYMITKNKATPLIYPRQYNQIKKKDI